VPEFFSKRYHDDRHMLNALAAIFIIVFFIPYTASGFAACGKLFNSLFGVDYTAAMIVAALVIVGYTLMGGFGAVSTTDLIQSIVMTVALVTVLSYGIYSAGGWDAVMANAHALPGYLSMTASYDAATGSSTPYGALAIASCLSWGLGYFGMPHILLRFMAIEDEKKLVLSRRIATVWVFIAMAVAIIIGIVGLGMTNAGALEFLASSASETIIVRIAGLISQHGVLAAILAGVILAGILAATMSTSDSQLLAAASSVSQNILQDFFHVKLSEKQSLMVARITIAAIAIVGVFLARDPNSSVFGIVSFAWAGFGGAFGAVMLCSLFWKRSNKWGALAGMVSGGLTVFLWKYLVRPLGGAWNIYELLPAFFVSLVFVVVVSLLTAAPDDSQLAEFDAAAL
jgi:sodium/proline symporter